MLCKLTVAGGPLADCDVDLVRAKNRDHDIPLYARGRARKVDAAFIAVCVIVLDPGQQIGQDIADQLIAACPKIPVLISHLPIPRVSGTR